MTLRCWEHTARGQSRWPVAGFSLEVSSHWTVAQQMPSFPSWRRVRIDQSQHQNRYVLLKSRNRSTNRITLWRPPLSRRPIACRETELGAQQLVVRVSLCNPRRGEAATAVNVSINLHIPSRTEPKLETGQTSGRSGAPRGVDVTGRPGLSG